MKKSEENLVRFIAYAPIIFIPTVIAFVIAYIYYMHSQNLNLTLYNIKEDILKVEKKALKSRIDNIADLIVYQESLINEKLKNRVKERVESSHKIATTIYETYKDKLPEYEIKNIIKTTLRPLLWNDGESFIWILDYEGVFQLAPKYLRGLEGKSIIEFKSSNGKYIIKEEIEICKTKGDGFIRDKFTKPNEPGNTHEQLAYVKAFGVYDWYFGSSEYLNTATKKSDAELLKSIDKLSDAGKGYLFVIDDNGKMLFNPSFARKDLNIDYKKIQNSHMKNVIDKYVNEIKKSGYMDFEYLWFNPDSKRKEKKFTYAKRVESKGWIIGSGIYESDIVYKAKKRVEQLQRTYDVKLNNLLAMGGFIMFFALSISLWLSKYLKKRFHDYELNISEKNIELEELNTSLEEKVQERTFELENSQKILKELATTDPLTKINNRYSIMKILSQEISRCKRSTKTFCVIMYDLDFFKSINDRYGHHEGDRILIKVCDVIKNRLRETDYIGRYGGEEFIVVLPETILEDAVNLANVLRESVESGDYGVVKGVSISLGVVQYDIKESSDELFKRIDSLLYDAKKCGRNCICF